MKTQFITKLAGGSLLGLVAAASLAQANEPCFGPECRVQGTHTDSGSFVPEKEHGRFSFERIRASLRRWSWKKNTDHSHLLFSSSEPHWLPGYGYHETQWRRGDASADCNRCPVPNAQAHAPYEVVSPEYQIIESPQFPGSVNPPGGYEWEQGAQPQMVPGIEPDGHFPVPARPNAMPTEMHPYSPTPGDIPMPPMPPLTPMSPVPMSPMPDLPPMPMPDEFGQPGPTRAAQASIGMGIRAASSGFMYVGRDANSRGLLSHRLHQRTHQPGRAQMEATMTVQSSNWATPPQPRSLPAVVQLVDGTNHVKPVSGQFTQTQRPVNTAVSEVSGYGMIKPIPQESTAPAVQMPPMPVGQYQLPDFVDDSPAVIELPATAAVSTDGFRPTKR